MKKRLAKKQGLIKQESEKERHSVPEELIQRIKEKVNYYLMDEDEDIVKEEIKVWARRDWKGNNIIIVKAAKGHIVEEQSSPNYHGNELAKFLIEEVKEIEFVGFDCYYDVELEFKLRN